VCQVEIKGVNLGCPRRPHVRAASRLGTQTRAAARRRWQSSFRWGGRPLSCFRRYTSTLWGCLRVV